MTLEKVHACQQALMDAMIGWDVPVIMSALTGITGGLILESSANERELRERLTVVMLGIEKIAEQRRPGPANG